MDKQDAQSVTQDDREAAASFYQGHLARPGEVPVAAAMRMGHIDESPLIQAFARHRLASQPTSAEDAVAGHDPRPNAHRDNCTCEDCVAWYWHVDGFERGLNASTPPQPEGCTVADVKREIMGRTRHMMGLLADMRSTVDLDDESSEGVLGCCDDLETAVHNIGAVASYLSAALIPEKTKP